MSGGNSDDARTYAESLVGRTLKGKWRLDQLVGVGGMAAVFAATHRNGDRVAVKVLHPVYAMQSSVRVRFVREGYAANSVGHPGVVNVRDDEIDVETNTVFLVMELLQGETVDARQGRMNGRMPLEEVIGIGEACLDVLAAAHDKGIHHRDIKPDNLFVNSDGKLKVLDFGIAKLREASHEGGAITQTGAMVGTPAFMSPEQVMNSAKSCDGQSDIWSLGATMFSLLTNRFVHEADSAAAMLVQAATNHAPKILTIRPDIPDGVAAVVDKALAFQKHDRWLDARAMLAALREARAAAGIPEGTLSIPRTSLPEPTSGAKQVMALATTVTPPAAYVQPSGGDSSRKHAAADTPPQTTTVSHQPKGRSRSLFVGLAGLVLVSGLAYVLVVRGNAAPASEPPTSEKQAVATTQAVVPPGATIEPSVVVQPVVAPSPSATATLAPSSSASVAKGSGAKKPDPPPAASPKKPDVAPSSAPTSTMFDKR